VGKADVMREIEAAYERGGVEAIIDYFHPDFEGSVPPELGLEPDTYRGREGVRRWFAGFEGSLEDVRMIFSEPIEAGDRLVVPIRLRARGVDSGIEVEQRAVQVWSFRDGKVAFLDGYADLESAMEAAS
jgi:ketosteroid isomerase-like protein